MRWNSNQHIWREIRVWAIQWHLQKHIGKPVNFKRLGHVGYFLPDRWKAFPESVDWLDRQACDDWFAKQIERVSKKYTIEGILEELERRKAILVTNNPLLIDPEEL